MGKNLETEAQFTRRQLLAGIGVGSALLGSRSNVPASKGLVHLNTGSLGTPLIEAEIAVAEAIQELKDDPVGSYWGSLTGQANQARTLAAEFLGCDSKELAFTACTTDGMNAAALGLELKPGDRILTSDDEHAGGSLCWEYLVKKKGVEIDKVELPVPPKSSRQLVQAFTARMTDRTRVISVSHVTSSTGLRMPVKSLAKLAHSNQALMIVDGAQAAGAIDIDLHDIGCDVYATSGHKWLCGPIGTGLLFVREGAKEQVDPMLLQSGPGAYTASTGTRDLPSRIGLGVAVDFLAKLGIKKLEKRNLELRNFLFSKLSEVPNLKMVSPESEELSAPMVSFQVPGVDPSKLAGTLRHEHGIVIKTLNGKVPGNRVSTHFYNFEADVDRFVSTLNAIL
jgi:selenocysteine lyase/cysteine desulfurase